MTDYPPSTTIFDTTNRMRRILWRANQLAAYKHNEYVGTVDLLLAILKESHPMSLATQDCGSAIAAFRVAGIDVKAISEDEELALPASSDMTSTDKLPRTRTATMAIGLAAKEANAASSGKLMSVHLLLGLLRAEHSAAYRVLSSHGCSLESLRKATRVFSIPSF